MNRESIIVYGTGIQAQAFYTVAGDKYSIVCFMVSDLEPSVKMLYGIPVCSVHNASDDLRQYTVYIATIDKYYAEIVTALDDNGFYNHKSMTFESMAWTELRIPYLKSLFCAKYNREFGLVDELACLNETNNKSSDSIFCVTSPFDNSKINIPQKYAYENMILAGAYYCNASRKEELLQEYNNIQFDTEGDNISEKNKQYCELTALYWIWKNDKSKYKGLCHYRRHFYVGEKTKASMEQQNIDVILTVPIVNFPSVYEIYRHDHCIDDLEVMKDAIKKLAPEYVDATEEILEGNFYSGYNMLIARNNIFNEYCIWLFPILDYIEKQRSDTEDGYQERYIGFLAERLLTIFFWKNWDKYNIAFSRKEFLE